MSLFCFEHTDFRWPVFRKQLSAHLFTISFVFSFSADCSHSHSLFWMGGGGGNGGGGYGATTIGPAHPDPDITTTNWNTSEWHSAASDHLWSGGGGNGGGGSGATTAFVPNAAGASGSDATVWHWAGTSTATQSAGAIAAGEGCATVTARAPHRRPDCVLSDCCISLSSARSPRLRSSEKTASTRRSRSRHPAQADPARSLDVFEV